MPYMPIALFTSHNIFILKKRFSMSSTHLAILILLLSSPLETLHVYIILLLMLVTLITSANAPLSFHKYTVNVCRPLVSAS
jgi:hypothetical protein